MKVLDTSDTIKTVNSPVNRTARVMGFAASTAGAHRALPTKANKERPASAESVDPGDSVCAPCARDECPCNSYTGDEGEYCGYSCLRGKACTAAWHVEPRDPSEAYLQRLSKSQGTASGRVTPPPRYESTDLSDGTIDLTPHSTPASDSGATRMSLALHQDVKTDPWAADRWQTKRLPGFDIEANGFYPRKDNGWFVPVLVQNIVEGPDAVGMFPTATTPCTKRQLRHGVFASVLKPLTFLDAKRQFEIFTQIWEAKAQGTKCDLKPETASTVERNLLRRTMQVAAQRRNTVEVATPEGVHDKRPLADKFTMSGVYIPHSGWDDAILQHIMGNLQKLFEEEPWSEADVIHFHQQLVERDWSTMEMEVPDLLLDMALHDQHHKSVSRSKTADRLMKSFQQVLEETGSACLGVTVRAWFQRLHLQPDTPPDYKLRTHAKNCPARAGIDWCKRADPINSTLCPAQLKHSTMEGYLSMLKSHDEAIPQLVNACESKMVMDVLKELKSAQISAGRYTVGGAILPFKFYVAMCIWIRQQRDKALECNDCPTVVFKWDAFLVYFTSVKHFARRGVSIALMEKARVWLLKTPSMKMVMAVDLVQNKIEECDPTALTFVDNQDHYNPLRAMQEMYENLVSFGVDVSIKGSQFVLSRYELRDGYPALVPASKSNPSSTWTPAQFDPLMKQAAKAVSVPGWEKITVKSLRMLNVVLGSAAGLPQEELNIRCGWKPGSLASENYVRLARMLGKPKPTVSDAQRQALREAMYVPFAELVQEDSFPMDSSDPPLHPSGEQNMSQY